MFRLLFLGTGWADCVEIWYALGNPLAKGLHGPDFQPQFQPTP